MATILVIEDANELRSTISACLRFYGHIVIEAQCGHDGANCHAQATGAFDLVVCDLFMKDGGGGETIRRMRRRDPRLPILAISGSRQALNYVSYSYATGFGTLTKPFTVTEFIRTAEQLLPPPTDDTKDCLNS